MNGTRPKLWHRFTGQFTHQKKDKRKENNAFSLVKDLFPTLSVIPNDHGTAAIDSIRQLLFLLKLAVCLLNVNPSLKSPTFCGSASGPRRTNNSRGCSENRENKTSFPLPLSFCKFFFATNFQTQSKTYFLLKDTDLRRGFMPDPSASSAKCLSLNSDIQSEWQLGGTHRNE